MNMIEQVFVLLAVLWVARKIIIGMVYRNSSPKLSSFLSNIGYSRVNYSELSDDLMEAIKKIQCLRVAARDDNMGVSEFVLADTFNTYHRDEIKHALRLLRDAGKIEINRDGVVHAL